MRANTVKTIAISEEAYRLLLGEKREGESFSDVIIRLVKGNKGDIMDYAGIWIGMSDDEVRKLFEDLKKVWERRNVHQ
mgnify:CR=1 FL=1